MAPSIAAQSESQTARDDLKKRAIPHMVLSTGDSQSMTAAPTAVSHEDAKVNASERFSVSGNAIVTGGTGTLGLAVCHALLEHGLSGLAIFDVNPAQSEILLRSLRDRFPEHRIAVLQVDVTDETAVRKATETAVERFSSINHLFCFSGIVGCVNAIDMTSIEWRRVIDVNTTGSFLCAQAVARHMIEKGFPGSITFTASISAHRVNYPQPQAAYNVSKAALITLKNCLAAEWARYGIRTNTISPGYMDTILNEGDGIAAARNTWAGRNPTGRLGVPSELTGAAVLLASAAGSYINGADIVVDGGGIVF